MYLLENQLQIKMFALSFWTIRLILHSESRMPPGRWSPQTCVCVSFCMWSITSWKDKKPFCVPPKHKQQTLAEIVEWKFQVQGMLSCLIQVVVNEKSLVTTQLYIHHTVLLKALQIADMNVSNHVAKIRSQLQVIKQDRMLQILIVACRKYNVRVKLFSKALDCQMIYHILRMKHLLMYFLC